MLRVYHREGAGRPARVRWALEEIGAPYEYVVMDKAEAAGDAHRARHPLGKVPVLGTDEGFQHESTAICLQLADLHPDAGLIPPVGSFERGQVYMWAVFAMTELEQAALRASASQRAGEPDSEQEQKLTDRLAVLDERLSSREYVAGDGFTIADIVVGATLLIVQRVEQYPPAGTFPALDAYLVRLDARPAKQRAYAD